MEEAGLELGLRRKRTQASGDTSRGKGTKGRAEQSLEALGMGMLVASGEILTAELGGGYQGASGWAGAEMKRPRAVLKEEAGWW